MTATRKPRVSWILLVGALCLGQSTSVSASTNVGGVIGTDTVWTAAGSPYLVGANILMANNATLTVQPGVEVRFGPDLDFTVSLGQIVARGTAASPILFTCDPGQQWRGFSFEDTSLDALFDAGGNYVNGCILEHVVVELASGYEGSGAVDITSCAPFITDSVIRDSAGYGLRARFAHDLRLARTTVSGNGSGLYFDNDCRNVVLAGMHIIDNDGAGLQIVTQYSSIVASQDPNDPTWLFGNGSYDLHNSMNFTGFSLGDLGSVDARNVWWGTTDPVEISAGIYDYMDNTNRGIVFYNPCSGPEAGDANLDYCVDGLDYVVWSNHYEPSAPGKIWEQGDFTGDGIVDGLDYIVWSNNYLQGCPGAPGPVPEPSCAVLLALGFLALRRRFGA